MVGKRYRLIDAALAIMNHEGQRFRMTIPRDGVVEVVAGPLDEDWLLDVIWKEKALTMFAIDVREHAELVADLTVPPSASQREAWREEVYPDQVS